MNDILPDQKIRKYWRIPREARPIISSVQRGSRVLDLGCGGGRFMRALQNERDCDCYGLDRQSRWIEQARLTGMNIEQCDIDEMSHPWLHCEWDVVLFCKSLIYMNAKNELLAKLKTKRIYINSRNTGGSPATPYRDADGSQRIIRNWRDYRAWVGTYGYKCRRLQPWRLNPKNISLKLDARTPS